MLLAHVKYQLERLGFEVRDGSKGGHKVYTHDGLPSFFSASFNCGHGKNPEIKPILTKSLMLLPSTRMNWRNSWRAKNDRCNRL